MTNKNKRLEQTLDELFKEARGHLHIKAIEEKQKQDDQAEKFVKSVEKDDSETNSDDHESHDENEDDRDQQAPRSSDDDDSEKLKDAEIEASDIIDKLNIIRSGRSFKDHTVKDNMQKYVDGLEPAEKTALLAFLKGIAQIAVGDIPAPDAVEPEDRPADVHMSKDKPKEKQTFHIKPNVINNQPGQEETKAPNSREEDTTAPQQLPIAAKKRR